MSFEESFERIQEDIGTASSWPTHIQELLLSSSRLAHKERLTVVCFLVGNGARRRDISIILGHYTADAKHVESIITDALSNRYDSRWYFFCLRRQLLCYLNGNAVFKGTISEMLSQKKL